MANRGQKGPIGTPALTGGSGRTKTGLSPCNSTKPKNQQKTDANTALEGYGKLLAQRFDYYQESIEVSLSSDLIRHLDDGQEHASAADSVKGVAIIRIGPELFQIGAHGLPAGGYRWVLKNDDFILLIRGGSSVKFKQNVSVRYLAAGLWEYDLDELRERAVALFRSVGCRIGTRLVTRVDYAFDFYAPGFEAEMVPGVSRGVVAHSSVKVRTPMTFSGEEHGTTRRVETLTIGTKASLQVQVYNKTVEIAKRPEKEWMYKVWGNAGWHRSQGHVWRLEFRYGGEYLKERGLKDHGVMMATLPGMLKEALLKRRLTVPNPRDTNERRWPLHPLWQLALSQIDAGFMPGIGHYFTDARDVHSERLLNQAAGTIRSAIICRDGTYDSAAVREFADQLAEMLEADANHPAKCSFREDYYAMMDEAR